MDKSTIVGTTEPGATVTVNNISVTPDSTGKFSYQITKIAKGTQNVTVIAKATNKEPTTAILEIKREITDGAYALQTQLINQTNIEVVGRV